LKAGKLNMPKELIPVDAPRFEMFLFLIPFLVNFFDSMNVKIVKMKFRLTWPL
jgi:hypothetical protein